MWFVTERNEFLYLGYELNITAFTYICTIFKLYLKLLRKSLAKEFMSNLYNSNFSKVTPSLNSYRNSCFCTADGPKNITFHKISPPPKSSYLESRVRGMARLASSNARAAMCLFRLWGIVYGWKWIRKILTVVAPIFLMSQIYL